MTRAWEIFIEKIILFVKPELFLLCHICVRTKQKGKKHIMNQEIESVIRAKNGDADALNLLLDNNISYIYAIAFALLKNREDAEDAVQKTMITVWQSIKTLENPEAFKSWLYRIAHTRSLNILQAKKNERIILDDDIGDMPQLEDTESELMLPQAYAERDDLRDRLNRIIDGLSAVQRETIVLYYFNDRSVREIAEIMDCSENTVKSRLYLARNSIRTEIEEQERKSGEKFYGVAIGALPIGSFVAEHVKNSMPPAGTFGKLTVTARQAGHAAAAHAGEGSAVSGKVGSLAAKTAAKGLPTAMKAVIATVGIAAVSVAGVMTAKLITDGQQHETAPTETQSVVETEAPTETPTEPDYSDAYRAYIEALQNNESDIKAYDWQLGDDESRPVVFADIMGDDTPEMIVAYCEVYANVQKTAFLEIYQYQNDKAQVVFSKQDSINNAMSGLDYDLAPGDQVYALYKRADDKQLYMYFSGTENGTGYTVYTFEETGEKLTPHKSVERMDWHGFSENTGKIDSADVGEDEARRKIREMLSDATDILMCNTPDIQNRYADEFNEFTASRHNTAMTYDEAVAFLRGKLGIVAPTEARVDLSAVSGDYETNIDRLYAAELSIDNNGEVSVRLQHLFTDSRAEYVGALSDPAENDDGAYTFTLRNMEMTSGTRPDSEIDTAFHDGCSVGFYPKGFMPRSMTEGQFRTFLQALPTHADEPLRTDFIFFSDDIMFTRPDQVY